MAERLLTQSAFEVSSQLIAHPLASPLRRLGAFLFDWILLSIPTLLVSCVVAVGSLLLTDPDGLRGIRTLMTGEQDEKTTLNALIDIAPLLVRIDAPGLPASVKAAVEGSDARKAGELLVPYDFNFYFGTNPPPPAPDQIRVEIRRLIPNTIRGVTRTADSYTTGFRTRS